MHRFAKLLALATLCLIFAGGLVKSTETGLSDPTWPHFNGGYEPQLHGATLYEHSHRLIAGTVATATIALAVFSRWFERRRWVKNLALVAGLAVLTQATFGGLTVLFKLKSLGVSLTHAGLAQAFLCIVTALATVTAPSWLEADAALPRPAIDRRLVRLSTLLALAVYAQVLLGAWVRYTPGAAFAIADFPTSCGRWIPESLHSETVRVQFIHRVGALVVTLVALATAVTALARHRGEPLVRRPALLLLAVLTAQVLLGGATIWTVKAVLPTTLHVVTGAGLLATSVVLALRARRHSGMWAPASEKEEEAKRAPSFAKDLAVLTKARRHSGMSFDFAEPSAPLRSGRTEWKPGEAKKPSFAKDLAVLTKARIALFVVIAAAAGFYLAERGAIDWGVFASGTIGAALLAASASALNQVIERDHDARMRRTADRPLPSGRLSTGAALAIGAGLGVAGTLLCALGANALTAVLGAATLVSYVAIYTPLKRASWLSTIVGAVPGAMPPVLGWAAARGEVGLEAWTLFAIIFFWQLPHFFAIAWIHREDYARGGFPMLTVVEPDGASTSRQVMLNSVALLAISLLPSAYGITGRIYLGGALLMGAAYLALAWRLASTRTIPSARRVFLASLVHLPALFGLMSLDKRA